jgi:hypothetical protein
MESRKPISKHRHARNASAGDGVHQEHVPYWQRAHTDWRFWVGVVLMFGAMIVYVMSFDLALRPQLPPPSSTPGAVGK